MASLFTDQTPVLADNDDGTPGISTATSIRFGVSGQVTDIRFYSTTTVGGTYTGELYEVTASDDTPAGTLLESGVLVGAPASGQWVTIPLDNPVAVTPTTKLYRAVVHNTQGRYVATVGFAPFVNGGGGVTNGDLYGPDHGTDPVGLGSVRQGVFRINAAAGGYPSSSGNGTCYFVDVVFTADAGVNVRPDSLAIPITLGEPTIGHPLAPSPDSLEIPIFLGSPASQNGEVLPAAGGGGGGWWSLVSILEEQGENLREDRAEAPSACPNDGEPLLAGPKGELYCPYDGWRPR